VSLLEVNGLNAYYGDSHILFDVSLRVEKHEAVALVGRNGAGKSTTLKSLMGVVARRTGSIRLDGVELVAERAHSIARLGMQLVHEDRRIFGNLNVEENIILAGLTAKARWPLDRIYAMFPRLKERRTSRGTDLSGGEQQMLAIARAMMLEPKIILLDEPTEGLMPRMVSQIRDIIGVLHRDGVAVLLVEQNVPLTLDAGQRIYIIEKGVVRHHAPAADLRADDAPIHRYMGV
jgi:branched-chain amino acid transport system ATP-binding protein